MTLTDAAVLIGIGLGVGGFLVTVWQQWLGYRDRRSAQRQHLYETQVEIFLSFSRTETELFYLAKDIYYITQGIFAFKSRGEDKPELLAQYREQLPALRKLEGKLVIDASGFGLFLPDEIAQTAGKLVGVLRMFTQFICDLDKILDKDDHVVQVALFNQLDKFVVEAHRELYALTRKHLGIDRLTVDIQELFGEKVSMPKTLFNAGGSGNKKDAVNAAEDE